MTEKVAVGGVELAVRLDGDVNKPWLVLSNSLGSTMAMWDLQITALTAHFRLLRYDTRGHGASDVPAGPYSFDDFTGDAIGLMDHFGIAKAAFMGVSLGGMTGMGLGLKHPGRLSKLVVADARSDAPEGFRTMWDQRIARIEEGGITAIIDGTLDSWISPETLAAHPERAEAVRAMVGGTDAAGYIATCRGLQQLDYFRHLHGLAVPTLYIGGSEDKGAAPDVMKAMADQTPGSAFISLDGARHLANFDQPEAFNDAVLGFLTKEA